MSKTYCAGVVALSVLLAGVSLDHSFAKGNSGGSSSATHSENHAPASSAPAKPSTPSVNSAPAKPTTPSLNAAPSQESARPAAAPPSPAARTPRIEPSGNEPKSLPIAVLASPAVVEAKANMAADGTALRVAHAQVRSAVEILAAATMALVANPNDASLIAKQAAAYNAAKVAKAAEAAADKAAAFHREALKTAVAQALAAISAT